MRSGGENFVTHKLHAISPPAVDAPKTIPPTIKPVRLLLVKNDKIPIANPTFNTARNMKKFIRSNSQPHTGLKISRATFGITPVKNATSTTDRLRPYFGFARYSTRIGNIIKFAVPISIHAINVNRSTRSVPTKRNARNGCAPSSRGIGVEGHRFK